MQNTISQVQNPSTLLNLLYNYPFWNNYSLQYFFAPSFSQKVDSDHQKVSPNTMSLETDCNEQYKSQSRKNISLNSRNAPIYKKLKVSKITESDEQTTRVPKKPSQKETRNVSSNLMRIFLKNLIELKAYTRKINSISARLGNNFTQEEFYLWVQGFGINFKNYIRAAQVTKMIGTQQPEHFRKTFLILLKHFEREMGLQHCLTSKRIERNSLKMHLEGLRSMSGDLLKQCSTKN